MVQCSWRSFFFGGENPDRFALPQVRWPLQPMSFLAYRWLFVLYQLTSFILTAEFWCLLCDKGVFFTYITDWAFISLLAYSTWSAFATTYWHMKGKHIVEEKERVGSKFIRKNSRTLAPPVKRDMAESAAAYVVHNTPWYFKVTWCLQVQACSVGFAITVLYWVIIYVPGESPTDYFNINAHGVGVAMLMVDFFLVANPCRLFHAVYAGAYALVYFLFTYAYYVLGGRNPGRGTAIYTGAVDWGELPIETLYLALFAILVASPVSHAVFFAIHLLKVALGKCCTNSALKPKF